MHPVMEELQMKKIENVMENLRRNNMEAVYAKDRAEALLRLRTYLTPGCTVGVGGSVTLDEIGALELFRCGDYKFLDRYAPGLSKEEQRQIFRQSLLSDVYVMSANAVTETGALYNVDGNANRVAALLYGPESVIVIIGHNKIVPTVEDAVRRVKTVAAPANAARLSCPTPCTRTGMCVSMMRTGDDEIPSGCASESRICANYVISGKQRQINRIKVILVGEALGF